MWRTRADSGRARIVPDLAFCCLVRRWPQEYGRVERRIEQPDENKNIGVTILYDTGGKTMEELLDFPIEGKDPREDRRPRINQRFGQSRSNPSRRQGIESNPNKSNYILIYLEFSLSWLT